MSNPFEIFWNKMSAGETHFTEVNGGSGDTDSSRSHTFTCMEGVALDKIMKIT